MNRVTKSLPPLAHHFTYFTSSLNGEPEEKCLKCFEALVKGVMSELCDSMIIIGCIQKTNSTDVMI